MGMRMIMLNMDPPQHVKFRRIVQRGFTPQMTAKQEPVPARAARSASSTRSRTRGECDFVEELAAELPLQVICELMGVPQEDRKLIFELSNNADRLRRPGVPEHRGGRARRPPMQMFGYAMQLAAAVQGASPPTTSPPRS